MNGLHENIQQILELQHLTRVDYIFHDALKEETVLAGKPNSTLPFTVPTVDSSNNFTIKVGLG